MRGQTISPTAFLKAFLTHREISRPDGRPLCSYRCDGEEYGELVELLKARWQASTWRALKDRGFDRCFCLYASEWWRRNYSGGPWKWHDLLAEIGLDSLANSDLYRLVDMGLRFWERPLLTTGQGRGFLVTLACEGGLPLQLVRKEGNRLRAYFKALLEEFHIYREAAVEPARLAEQVADRLPRTLRQDVVYRVSGALIEQIWTLQAKIGETEDPVGTLDEVNPGWRDSLPLKIEDETASALLSNLVEEASRLAFAVPTKISVSRRLYESFSGWRLVADIELPGVTSIHDLALLLGADEDALSSRLELYVVDDSNSSTLVALASQRVRQGRREYLLEKPRQQSLNRHDEVAAQRFRLVASWGGSRLPACSLPHSDALSELPWVFVRSKSSTDLILLGEGSVRSRHPDVVVAAEPGDDPKPSDGSVCELLGELAEPRRSLYRVSGQVAFTDSDGASCAIRTGEKKEFSPHYRLIGQLAVASSDAVTAYAGSPKLYCDDGSGRMRVVEAAELEWRPVGTDSWKPGAIIGFGVFDLKHSVDGELHYRVRLGVVPPNLNVSYRHGSSYKEGQIELYGLEGADIGWHELPDVDMSAERRSSSNREVVAIRCMTKHEPPADVSLVLRWSDRNAIQLRFSYPARGGRFVAHGNVVLPNFSAVSFQELTGLRAIATSTRQSDTFIVHGSLLAHDISPDLNRSVGIWEELPREGSFKRSLELSYLQEQLSQLFGATSDLDACINLRLQGSTANVRQVEVRRFDMRFKPHRERSVVELEVDEHILAQLKELVPRLQIEAIPLWDPTRDPVCLDRCHESGAGSYVAWEIDESLMAPGPWLIVGREGAWCRIRPLLWAVPEHEPPSSSVDGGVSRLGHAIRISDVNERRDTLVQVIDDLAEHPDSPEWETAIQYFASFRGLPSASLDLFAQLAVNPNIVPALLFRADELLFDVIWERLDELPFSWHLVPIQAWLQAAHQIAAMYKKQLAGLDLEVDEFVRTAFSVFAERAPLRLQPMELISELIDVLGVVPGLIPEGGLVTLATRPAGQEILGARLAEARQDLLRAQADTNWPQGLQVPDWLADYPAAADEFKDLLLHATEGAGFRSDVLNAPVVAAIACAAGELSSTALAVEIKRLRRFDERWFDTAYSITLALAISKILGGA